jgi:hypothetical protein
MENVLSANTTDEPFGRKPTSEYSRRDERIGIPGLSSSVRITSGPSRGIRPHRFDEMITFCERPKMEKTVACKSAEVERSLALT